MVPHDYCISGSIAPSRGETFLNESALIFRTINVWLDPGAHRVWAWSSVAPHAFPLPRGRTIRPSALEEEVCDGCGGSRSPPR